jgi:hypothetical protein
MSDGENVGPDRNWRKFLAAPGEWGEGPSVEPLDDVRC